MPRAPQPWSDYLRDEWTTPALDALLHRYPPGHRYYSDDVIIRYYPLAMILGGLGAFVYSLLS